MGFDLRETNPYSPHSKFLVKIRLGLSATADAHRETQTNNLCLSVVSCSKNRLS